MPTSVLRRDAQRNRERLLAAARIVFAAEGTGASLQEIGRLAGVGAGTLYRHFPTRDDLVTALFEVEVERWLEASHRAAAIEDPWEAFRTYVTDVLELQAGTGLLPGVLLHRGPGATRVAEANAELSAVAAELVERARNAGAIRVDFTLSDLALVMWSFTPVIEATQDASSDAWRRHVTVVLDGIRSPSPTPHTVSPLTDHELEAARGALRPSTRPRRRR
jgi:AcrR family transcriptional regulator